MKLGDPDTAATPTGGQTTLDDLFRQAAARRPDATALIDPLDRERFTDGLARRLTYEAADRVISAIAVRLRGLGMATDTVVGIQLGNTVEAVLTLLGVLRAGLIAAPLPLLWRRAEMVAALRQVNAKAIVTMARIDGIAHGELASQVAADLFSIRHVCSFGTDLPDGVIALDDVFGASPVDVLPDIPRGNDPAAHIAVVTMDVAPDGLVAVARNHMELIAGGLAVMLEAGIEPDAGILAPIAPTSFSGMCLTMLPWLLAGGTLSLHHAFDPASFTMQCESGECSVVAVPGPLVARFADAGVFAQSGIKVVLAVWRTPERLAAASPWRNADLSVVDVVVFGETVLFGARRTAGGRPAPIPLGPIGAPRGSAGAVTMAELARSSQGSVIASGPMVPRHPFPPGAERRGAPWLQADEGGWVDTGYPCRIDSNSIVVTGPPPGIVSVGGYRFVLNELRELVAGVDRGAALAALPDALAGHRLAGSASDPASVQAKLALLGLNPLVARAFRARRRSGSTP